MTAPETPPPAVDFTSISFPSDRVTVAAIRRAHPQRFDQTGRPAFGFVEEDPDVTLNEMIDVERLVARAAFDRALGRGDPIADREMTRADCVDELTEYYRTYGVADGRHASDQLVRDIETQAEVQAGRRR